MNLERKLSRPTQEPTPSLANLRGRIENYINSIANGESINNVEHYVFESAVETFYGKDVWNWINKYRRNKQ